MIITNLNVERYQRCPYLFTRFDFLTGENIPAYKDHEFMLSVVYRVFFSQLNEKTRFLNREKIEVLMQTMERSSYYSSKYKPVAKAVKDLFIKFLVQLQSLSLQLLALNIDLWYQHQYHYYKANIPILFSDENQNIVPLYFHFPPYLLDRNNEIFHANTTIEQTMDVKIEKYMILHVDIENLNNFRLFNFPVTQEQRNQRAERLRVLMAQMTRHVQIPNTGACYNCEFIGRCNI